MLGQNTTHISLLARLTDRTDALAWREFCHRYGDLICGFARRRNLQPADCDDILQDVLLALTKAMPGFQYDPTRGRFRGYLKTVVERAISQRFRQKAGPASLDQDRDDIAVTGCDSAAEALWEAEWRQYHLRRAMRTTAVEFNDDDRAAFEACLVEGREPQQAAEALGLTVQQVYHARSRISRRLAELIEQQIEEEG